MPVQRINPNDVVYVDDAIHRDGYTVIVTDVEGNEAVRFATFTSASAAAVYAARLQQVIFTWLEAITPMPTKVTS